MSRDVRGVQLAGAARPEPLARVLEVPEVKVADLGAKRGAYPDYTPCRDGKGKSGSDGEGICGEGDAGRRDDGAVEGFGDEEGGGRGGGGGGGWGGGGGGGAILKTCRFFQYSLVKTEPGENEMM